MRIVVSCLCIALFSSQFLQAETLQERFSQFEGKFRFGKELEVKPEILRMVIPFFQFASDSVPKSIADEYLNNPEAFHSLPDSVKAELTEGLKYWDKKVKLERVTTEIISKDGGSIPKGIISSGSSVITTTPETKNTDTISPGGLILPKSAAPAPGKSSILDVSGNTYGEPPKEANIIISETSRRGADWSTIARRWRAMPLEKRTELIDWKHVNPVDRATLAIYDPNAQITLLEELDGKAKKAFPGLEWEPEGDVFEFRDRRPTDSAVEYLERLEALTDITLLSGTMKAPIKNFKNISSYHVHISDRNPLRNLGRVAKALNRLWLLRFIGAGEGDSVLDPSQVSFRDQANSRSLVSIAFNRGLTKILRWKWNEIEIRTHTKDPVAELEEVLRWLDMPEHEALTSIYSEIKELLDEEASEYLQAKRPKVNRDIQKDIAKFTRPGGMRRRIRIARYRFEHWLQSIPARMGWFGHRSSRTIAGANCELGFSGLAR